jgi:hypothetical protein
MFRTLLIALCLGLVAICGGRARADLVVNGGFETETPAGCQTAANPSACNVPPPGWTITGDGVSIDTAFPHTGTYDIAFATASTDPNIGMLSQALTTTVEQNYTLTFFVMDEAGFPLDTFTVSYGGFTDTITGDEAPFAYTQETFTVPGAGTANLTFEGINDIAAWNLDDVSLVLQSAAVPEPAAGILFGTALILWLCLFLPGRLRRPRRLEREREGRDGGSRNGRARLRGEGARLCPADPRAPLPTPLRSPIRVASRRSMRAICCGRRGGVGLRRAPTGPARSASIERRCRPWPDAPCSGRRNMAARVVRLLPRAARCHRARYFIN